MFDIAQDEFNFLLPKLFEEDIYFIKSEYIDTVDLNILETQNSKIANTKVEEPKKVIAVLPTLTQKVEIRTFEKPLPSNFAPPKPTLIAKKVIVLVAYKDIESLPLEVEQALDKIFAALKVEKNIIEIINVLARNSKNIEDYTYQYLILMGGKGKNIAFLQNYDGGRDFYTIISHANRKAFFCESMEVYLKDLELKKKFWAKLVEFFK